MGFGRVLGGFLEDFGKVWGLLGACRTCWKLTGMLFVIIWLHCAAFCCSHPPRRAERGKRSEPREAPEREDLLSLAFFDFALLSLAFPFVLSSSVALFGCFLAHSFHLAVFVVFCYVLQSFPVFCCFRLLVAAFAFFRKVSPARVAIYSFLCLSLGFPTVFLNFPVPACFLLFCFSACSTAPAEWFPGHSLTLSCFPLSSLALSCFILCCNVFKNSRFPFPC